MVKIKYLVIAMALFSISCNAQIEYSALEPDSVLDKIIENGDYDLGLETIKNKVKNEKMNTYTAQQYEFKILYLANDSEGLDDFVERLIQVETMPETMLQYLYGLKRRNRESSYRKMYSRIQELFKNQLLETSSDSCMIYFQMELSHQIYDSNYVTLIDSIDNYCSSSASREYTSELLSARNLARGLQVLFDTLLSKDYLWSENLQPIDQIPHE